MEYIEWNGFYYEKLHRLSGDAGWYVEVKGYSNKHVSLCVTCFKTNKDMNITVTTCEGVTRGTTKIGSKWMCVLTKDTDSVIRFIINEIGDE